MIDYWILEKSVVTNHGVIKDTISSKHFYPNTLNYVYQYFLKKKKNQWLYENSTHTHFVVKMWDDLWHRYG